MEHNQSPGIKLVQEEHLALKLIPGADNAHVSRTSRHILVDVDGSLPLLSGIKLVQEKLNLSPRRFQGRCKAGTGAAICCSVMVTVTGGIVVRIHEANTSQCPVCWNSLLPGVIWFTSDMRSLYTVKHCKRPKQMLQV